MCKAMEELGVRREARGRRENMIATAPVTRAGQEAPGVDCVSMTTSWNPHSAQYGVIMLIC